MLHGSTDEILNDARAKIRQLEKLIPGDLEVSRKTRQCIDEITFLEDCFRHERKAILGRAVDRLYFKGFVKIGVEKEIEISEDMFYAIRKVMMETLEGYLKEIEYYIRKLEKRTDSHEKDGTHNSDGETRALA